VHIASLGGQSKAVIIKMFLPRGWLPCSCRQADKIDPYTAIVQKQSVIFAAWAELSLSDDGLRKTIQRDSPTMQVNEAM
jgi:hypothetical protein